MRFETQRTTDAAHFRWPVSCLYNAHDSLVGSHTGNSQTCELPFGNRKLTIFAGDFPMETSISRGSSIAIAMFDYQRVYILSTSNLGTYLNPQSG